MSCVGVDRSRTITIFCCSVRPMFSVMCGLSCSLFMVVGCSCFYVVFVFYSRHLYFYLFYFLVSKMHISVYMLFTEWKCFCFFSFIEYCDEWGGAESRGNGARPVELMIMSDTCATHRSRVPRRSSGRIKGGATTVEDERGPGLDFNLCFVCGSRP